MVIDPHHPPATKPCAVLFCIKLAKVLNEVAKIARDARRASEIVWAVQVYGENYFARANEVDWVILATVAT